MLTHTTHPLRNFKCPTITRTGVRCGKYAEFLIDEGIFLCQNCYWKYIRARSDQIIKSDKVAFGEFEKIPKTGIISKLLKNKG